MGQRAFRGRITDSLIKRYCGNEIKEQNEEHFQPVLTNQKYIDIEYTFDLDNPLHNINSESVNLTTGLINLTVPRGYGINHLNILIISSHLGQGKSLLHSNLYLLFGSHFFFDVKKITITLFNPITNSIHNDRKLIQNVLDGVCFKKIQQVSINKTLLYYVIPEYSEFSIVIAYNNTNYSETSQISIKNLEDLLFHPYCIFEASKTNFRRCLNAIQKTIPEDISNIILPVIYFKNNVEEENYPLFAEFAEFLEILSSKSLKVVSFELKIKNVENFTKTISEFIKSIQHILPKFMFLLISFEFCNYIDYPKIEKDRENLYSYESNKRHELNSDSNALNIQEIFKKTIIDFQLNNVAFAHHVSFSKINKKTNLEDLYDFYDYIYYDRCYAYSIYNLMQILKHKVNKLSKINYLKNMILENIHGTNYRQSIFKSGRIDYTTELVKNKKIVPLKFSNDNALIYKN